MGSLMEKLAPPSLPGQLAIVAQQLSSINTILERIADATDAANVRPQSPDEAWANLPYTTSDLIKIVGLIVTVNANLSGLYSLQIGNTIHHSFYVANGTSYIMTLPIIVSRGLPISIVPPSGVAVPLAYITFLAVVVE